MKVAVISGMYQDFNMPRRSSRESGAHLMNCGRAPTMVTIFMLFSTCVKYNYTRIAPSIPLKWRSPVSMVRLWMCAVAWYRASTAA